MLFEAERRTALAFQQSLLPDSVPELDGLEVAFRYVPAKPLATQGQGIQTQVGGDWYDIIPLAAGRVGLVIGDVEGRGARAAATMGQLRAALRAYAQDEKSPADIMRKLDEWVRSTAPVGAGGDPPTVSCIYLIYDAWSRSLTFANAGHAAPLMALDGGVRPLEVRHKGVLLGVRGRGIRGLPTYREQTVTLPPGAALVLYTDGLTDRRTRADGDGHYTEAEAVAMLRDALLASSASADALAVAAENAVPGDIDDDMAILVFRSSQDDLASSERSFPAEPIMVSEARRLASATFAAWDMHPDQADLALLLVSEVVTNAVLHASVTPSPAGRRFDLELDPLADTSAAGDERRGRSPRAPASRWPRTTPRCTGRGSSRCGCAGARSRSGWRSSTRTCGSPGCAPPAPPTRAAAGSTWSSSWPPAGAPGRPRTARPSGSRSRWTARRAKVPDARRSGTPGTVPR